MKISIESVGAGYLSKVNSGIKGKQSAPIHEPAKNFDQLMINSNSRRMAEEQLEVAAKKEVNSLIFQRTDQSKLDSIKEQVSGGNYRVDADAIASKILLLGGE